MVIYILNIRMEQDAHACWGHFFSCSNFHLLCLWFLPTLVQSWTGPADTGQAGRGLWLLLATDAHGDDIHHRSRTLLLRVGTCLFRCPKEKDAAPWEMREARVPPRSGCCADCLSEFPRRAWAKMLMQESKGQSPRLAYVAGQWASQSRDSGVRQFWLWTLCFCFA